MEQEFLHYARGYASKIGVNRDLPRAWKTLNNIKRMRKRTAAKEVPDWYRAALHSLQICAELRIQELTDNQ